MKKSAASTPLPKIKKDETALMTLYDFLEHRNPENKSHAPSSYDSDLKELNRIQMRYLGNTKTRNGKFEAYQTKDGYLIKEVDGLSRKTIAVVKNKTLYHISRFSKKEIPTHFDDIRNNTTEIEVNRYKLVKYLAPYIAQVENAAKENYERFTHLEQRIKVKGTPYEIRFEGKPRKDKGTTIAIMNEDGLVVATASNEWGATLLQVAKEFRGRGLGRILGKFWYQYNPSFLSGGFTPAGEQNARKIWSDRVRKFLKNGWYSQLIKKGLISKEKVKKILSEIKGSKTPSKLESLEKPKKILKEEPLIMFDGSIGFYIYDRKFLEDPDEKYIYGYGFFRDSKLKGVTYLYTIDYTPKYRKLAHYVALQMARNKKQPLYDGQGYGDVLELEGLKDIERNGDLIHLTKDMINIPQISRLEKRIRKSLDQYDEKKVLLMEMSESKWS